MKSRLTDFQFVEIVKGDQRGSLGRQDHEVQMCWGAGRHGICSGSADGTDRRARFAESARPDMDFIQMSEIEYLIVKRIQSPHAAAASNF